MEIDVSFNTIKHQMAFDRMWLDIEQWASQSLIDLFLQWKHKEQLRKSRSRKLCEHVFVRIRRPCARVCEAHELSDADIPPCHSPKTLLKKVIEDLTEDIRIYKIFLNFTSIRAYFTIKLIHSIKNICYHIFN